jgi:predicted metal-dependent enzyme (double-stranded beta helix superfamily)
MMHVPVPNESAWIRRVVAILGEMQAPDCDVSLEALRDRLVPLAFAEGCPRAGGFALDADTRRLRRHPLVVGEDSACSALVMVWPPGYSTLPHDHAGLWGIELVVDGALEVDEFVRIGDPARPALARTRSLYLGIGDAAVFSGDAYVHRCRNLSTTRAAVSLHVYGGVLDAYRAFLVDAAGRWRAQSERAGSDVALN